MRLTAPAVALAIVATVVSCTGVWSSPTGLNNIPTADYTPEHALVLQTYDFMQSGERTGIYLGVKYGLGHGIEVGVDKRLTPTPDGPTQLQAKKTWDLVGDSTRLCVGVSNVTDNPSDHPRHPYAVVTQKLSSNWRGHAGYAPERDNREWFVGTDYTLPCGTVLRGDAVHSTTQSATVYGLGALVPTRFGAVEGWVSRLSDGATGGSDATVYTLKLDWAVGH